MEKIIRDARAVQLYADGAYLIAAELKDGTWGWVVAEFDGETFLEGVPVCAAASSDKADGAGLLTGGEEDADDAEE